MNMHVNTPTSFYIPYEPFKVPASQYNFGSMTNYVDSVPVTGDFPAADPNSAWSAFTNKLIGDGKDYFTNTPWMPKFDPVTGKTSRSILGDFGSLAQFGLQGANVYGQFQGLKEARKNRELMASQLDKSNKFNTLRAHEDLTSKIARLEAKAGQSSTVTRGIASKKADEELGKYGLNPVA